MNLALLRIRGFVEIYIGKKAFRSAAQLAYFLTLSIFPFLICMTAVLGTLNVDESQIIYMLSGIIPEETVKTLTEYIDYVQRNFSLTMLIGGTVLMISSSAAAFRALMSIMADIQGKARFHGIYRVLISFVMSIVLVAAIYISAAVILTGEWLAEKTGIYLKFMDIIDMWQWMKFVILFLLIFVIIYCVYRIGIPRSEKKKAVLPGALFASLMLVTASVFFSWVMGISVRYPLVYGSLASIIILMVWFYICSNILICGSIFNAVIKIKERK